MLDAFYQWVTDRAQAGALPGFLRHTFMVRALLASLLLAPLLGSIGPLVVTRRLAFFTAAIGHTALAGVSIGLFLGESLDRPYVGIFGFSLLMAVAVTYLRHRSDLPTDTIIGVYLSLSLGLGICLLVAITQRFNIHQVEAVLFGSLLTVNDTDLLLLFVVGVLTVGLLLPRIRGLFLSSLDPSLAHSRGVPILRDEYLFMIVLALVVTASIKVTGALLVEALVIVPAAAARNVARSLRSYFLFSIGFALLGTQAGMYLSGEVFRVPAGAAIVLCLGAVFVVTTVVRKLR